MSNENDDHDVDDNDYDDDDFSHNFRFVELDNDDRLHLSNNFFNEEQSKTRIICRIGIVRPPRRITSSIPAYSLDIEYFESLHLNERMLDLPARQICKDCERNAKIMIEANSRRRIKRRSPIRF
jgi:hypothetical protein